MEIAKLIFKSYMPLKLEKGMLFLKDDVLFELDKDTPNKEEYISIHGAPVEPCLIIEGNPNVPNDTYMIADEAEIGWWDEGDHTDDLELIGIDHYNFILQEWDGYVLVEGEWYDIDDDEAHQSYEKFIPEMFYDKVIIQPLNDEDDEDYNDDDSTNEDDEGPEYDGAGFTDDDDSEED